MRLTLCIRRLCIFIISAFIVFYIGTRNFPDAIIKVENPEFVQLNTCPLCYGHSYCEQLLVRNYAKLVGIRKLKLMNYLNSRNVYFAQLKSGINVVIKKLATNSESSLIGKKFCEMVDLEGCDPKNAVRFYAPVFMNEFLTQSMKSQAIFGYKDILACPSKRFISKILDTFMEDELFHVQNDRMDVVAEFLTIMHLNPEPLLLKAFKAEDGWPFPRYLGTCGRVAVEEYAGEDLAYYFSSSWETRLKLSYQLLRIAKKLTDNPTNFSFYLTDVNLHNFAVSSDGHLSLIDLENIVVVDKVKDWKDQPSTWNRTLINADDHCHNCLSYSAEDLCNHQTSDHNFYAICRGIIGPNSYYAGGEGFLHDIPNSIEQYSELKSLISECATPPTNTSRIAAGDKLLMLLMEIL